MELNTTRPRTFIEPFCGGASVSIALLEDGVIDRVALNDADPLIASLWSTVFSKNGSEWLAEKVMSIPLTIAEWKSQKELVPGRMYDAALKCLYLNRTSFNGIIHQSGPIGGWGQAKNTLDCRFNRERLASKILSLGKLYEQVSVSNSNWYQFFESMTGGNSAFFYIDPPYYYKAEQLYGFVFSADEHVALRDYLKYLKDPWLLSYDDAADVRALYADMSTNARVIDNTYSTHPLGGASFVGRELIYTNLKKLPPPDHSERTHIGISVRSANIEQAEKHPLRIPISTTAISLVTA